jgi:phage host-nuclease inhibitor protein Gam
MAELETQIKRIQEKLQLVLKKQDDLVKENQRLKKDIDKSIQQSTQYLQIIETLKQQVEVLKISSGNWDEDDKKEFEKRINFYVREIDKCIALMSQ